MSALRISELMTRAAKLQHAPDALLSQAAWDFLHQHARRHMSRSRRRRLDDAVRLIDYRDRCGYRPSTWPRWVDNAD